MRPYTYGKLNTANSCSEVRKIWHTRDDDLSDLPRCAWSFQLQVDTSQIENRNIIEVLLVHSTVNARELHAIFSIVLVGLTFQELGKDMGVSPARAADIRKGCAETESYGETFENKFALTESFLLYFDTLT